MVDKKAQPILDLFRGFAAGQLEPSGVRVEVLNGSGVTGQATTVSHDLASAGFGLAGTGDAETFDHARTVVRYAAGNEEAADLVVRWLVAGAEIEEVKTLKGADIVVVSGTDYEGVRDEPLPSTSSTSTTRGTSTTKPSTTTSSTVVGEVPEAPPSEVRCG
jgi:hypothetical protein